MVNDPYKVLGVSRNATPEEIKKAYRQKARQYHPDMHPDDPAANEKMNEINEAYDMLTNPEKYARQRAQSQGYGQSSQRGYGQGSGYGSTGSSGYGGSGYGSSGYNQNSYNGYNGGYQGQNGWSSNFYGFNFDDFFGAFSGQQNININPQAESTDSQEIRTAIQYINNGQYQAAIKILAAITSAGRNARWYYLCSVAYYGLNDMSHATDYIQRAVQMDPNNQKYQQIYSQFMRRSQTYSAYSYYDEDGDSSSSYQPRRRTGLFGIFIPIIIFYLLINLLFGGGCLGCYGCGGRGYNSYYSREYNQNNNGNGENSWFR